MRNDLSVSFAFKLVAFCFKLGSQLGEVLNHPVMSDRQNILGTAEVRVSVVDRRRTMSCPASVADPDTRTARGLGDLFGKRRDSTDRLHNV